MSDIWKSESFTADGTVVPGPGILKAVSAIGTDALLRQGGSTGDIVWQQAAGSTSGELSISFGPNLFVDLVGAGTVTVAHISAF